MTLRDDSGELVAAVTDDGTGFDEDGALDGSGLSNMRDRLDAVGGRITIEASTDGTIVTARVRTEGSS